MVFVDHTAEDPSSLDRYVDGDDLGRIVVGWVLVEALVWTVSVEVGAGMTPLHRESDTRVHRGRITKQGNNLVRWAAVEAVQKVHHGPIASTKVRLSPRRGYNIAKVAAARELLTLVYYGLRDGYIRCLARQHAA